MDSKLPQKTRWLRCQSQKWRKGLPRSSTRGQIVFETLVLFFFLTFIFSFLHFRMKEHESQMKKYRFKGASYESREN